MLDRDLRLIEPDSHPATQIPRSSVIWIKDERPVDQGRALFQLTGEGCEGDPSPTQREGAVLAQPHCRSREPPRFATFFGGESGCAPPAVTPGREGVGLGVVRVQLDGL